MALSADAQTYLAHFEHWDPEGSIMRGLWERISPAEREEIREALREQMHARNADHAETILRDLPKKWRDIVIERVKDPP
jgi:hypothetical protein